MAVRNPIVALFDVDGTLVRAQGPSRHSRAFKAAFCEVFGATPTFAAGMHGMTDLQIFGLLARDMNLGDGRHAELAAQACRRMVEIYGVPDDGDGTYAEIPGVRGMLEALRARGVLLGLVTGNVPEVAEDKLQTTSLADFFSFGAFGSEGDDRTMLPPLAHTRAEMIAGTTIPARNVFVIGDTPRDVSAALTNGFRAVAVATGHLSVSDLEATGADLVVPNLEDVGPLLELMGLKQGRIRRRAEGL